MQRRQPGMRSAGHKEKTKSQNNLVINKQYIEINCWRVLHVREELT